MLIRNAALRKILRILLPLVLIPGTVAFGVFVLGQKYYTLISLVVMFLSLAFFATGFEKKRTGTRRLVVIAVLTALSVAGRFIPVIKPVAALCIITGIYLGGEAGFLVGALSAVISNMYFGQGPWTPFQMFSFGLIGLIAGLLSGIFRKSRIITVIYGLIAGVLYSCIMDIWTVLWYDEGFKISLYLTALSTAVPYMIRYAVSNVIFLWIFLKPFGEKLDRLRLKYGV